MVDSRGGSTEPAFIEHLVYAGSLTHTSYDGFTAAPSGLLCYFYLADEETEPRELYRVSSVQALEV